LKKLKPEPNSLPSFPPWITPVSGGLELRIKVVPGASRTEIVGVLGNRLKLRITSPPEQGKANKAVQALLERATGLKPLILKAGATSPEKTFFYAGDVEACRRIKV
jgi:uncharacterized protein (TIGR00251 family)